MNRGWLCFIQWVVSSGLSLASIVNGAKVDRIFVISMDEVTDNILKLMNKVKRFESQVPCLVKCWIVCVELVLQWTQSACHVPQECLSQSSSPFKQHKKLLGTIRYKHQIILCLMKLVVSRSNKQKLFG